MKKYAETRIVLGLFDLGFTYLKGMIRNAFSKESKRTSAEELLDELDNRVTDLEIQCTKSNVIEDPEKKIKDIDQKVKVKVSQALGLFDVKNTRTTSPVPKEGSKDAHYICGKIIKAGDRLVLISPPGAGKTAWAYHVTFAITEGRDPEFIKNGDKNRAPQVVEYYDAELDEDDRCQRYLGYIASPLFHLHPNCKYRTFYYLLEDINERTSNLTSDATVVIDNVYGLMPSMTSDETKTFLDGMDIIQRRLLARDIRLTIILVTHTTKNVVGVPRLKDVAGSAHFSRFAKSVMSLFVREDWKTVLVTNKRRYKGEKNALVMQLSETGYLHFEFVSEASINDNPIDVSEMSGEEDNGEKNESFSHEDKLEMWRMNHPENGGKGLSYRAIADVYKCNGIEICHTQVGKFIREIDAQMDMKSKDEEGM